MSSTNSEPEAPLFSAVILSFNSKRFLKHCVTSLAECFAAFTLRSEIFVVENGSHDGSREVLSDLARDYPGLVKPIFSDVNLGTTVSRNRALAQASGSFILVLDSDATIDKDALSALRMTLETNASIGLAVPRLSYPDGRFQISTDQFPTIPHKLKRFIALKSMERRASPPERLTDVDYAISACWLLRRDVLTAVGLLDEKIFYSPEDVDYCVRIWQAGYRIVYDPSAIATHDAQEISRGKKLSRFTLSHAKGLMYLFWKHRYCFNRKRLVARFPLQPESGG